MTNFQKNPLYRRASKRVQASARREWQRTEAGQAVKQIRSILNAGHSPGSRGGSSPIMSAMKEWGRSGWSDIARRTVASSDFGQMVQEVERYAKMGGSTGRLVSQFLGSLGPIGSLIRSMTMPGSRSRNSGLQGDIQSAIDFLAAVSPESLSRHGRKQSRGVKGSSKQSTRRPTTGEVSDQVEAAMAVLEQHGYEVTKRAPGGDKDSPTQAAPPKPPETYPGGVSKTTKGGQPGRQVELEVNGTNRWFPVNHPIVTKEMTQTPQSSNVYAYGYDYDTWTLHIRYQQNAKTLGMPYGTPTGRPGALYAYSNVPPKTFLDMHKASSKGGFVWDAIRVRGTVSGHQYDYRLAAVRDRYVPRKATYTPQGEMYIRRTVKARSTRTGKIEVLRSGADMRAGPFRAPPDRAPPNTGQ